MKISFDSRSLLFAGRREFLWSGEMHYFRVPAADWRRRMRLWKEAGGNFVATYVPWIVHEPEEGRIVFGDRPERDLAGFLRTAAEEGLQVLLRPGPYVYSELVRSGLPPWLFRDYPALRWKRPDGTDEGPNGSRISYLHPLFLEKARRWFRAVAEQARPFLAENGGPVAAVQLDNELAGIHFWFGALDANPETFGLGREDGRWPRWLARKYGSVAAANEAYGGAWASFAEIPPAAEFRPDAPAGEERRRRDFFRCYREQLLDYLATLQGWLREDGVPTPTCHNCGSRDLLPLFEGARDALGPDFLLGYDQYYSLGPAWPVENPTAAVANQTRCNVDWVRALGWPAVGMEIPGGSPADVPPILREDLLAYYMTHLAAGAKGINVYVFTGGPNFEGTGQSSDLYDYNAPVRADGSLNATYGAVADFGRLVAERRDLLEAGAALERVYIQISQSIRKHNRGNFCISGKCFFIDSDDLHPADHGRNHQFRAASVISDQYAVIIPYIAGIIRTFIRINKSCRVDLYGIHDVRKDLSISKCPDFFFRKSEKSQRYAQTALFTEFPEELQGICLCLIPGSEHRPHRLNPHPRSRPMDR